MSIPSYHIIEYYEEALGKDFAYAFKFAPNAWLAAGHSRTEWWRFKFAVWRTVLNGLILGIRYRRTRKSIKQSLRDSEENGALLDWTSMWNFANKINAHHQIRKCASEPWNALQWARDEDQECLSLAAIAVGQRSRRAPERGLGARGWRARVLCVLIGRELQEHSYSITMEHRRAELLAREIEWSGIRLRIVMGALATLTISCCMVLRVAGLFQRSHRHD